MYVCTYVRTYVRMYVCMYVCMCVATNLKVIFSQRKERKKAVIKTLNIIYRIKFLTLYIFIRKRS